MKKLLVFLAFISLISRAAFSQKVVYDQNHFTAVSENAAVRNAAELTHNQYLQKIGDNLQSINTSAGTIILAQTMIYNSLSNVNSALKDGLALKNIASIVSDMSGYTTQMLTMAKSQPYLLLFAENMATQMELRSAALLADVSGFILSGKDILADYNSRDQLLRKVTQELQILCSLLYGAYRAMFWAGQQSLFKTLNPFAGYLNTDRQIVDNIIANAKFLKK